MKKKWMLTFSFIVLLILSGCSSDQEPPNAFARFGDTQVRALKSTYEWSYGFLNTEKVVADSSSPSHIARQMKTQIVRPKAKAKITFSNRSNPRLSAHVWKNDREREELPIRDKQLALPKKEGNYVILLHARWMRGNAYYVLSVRVTTH
ncbi:hypothetical protein M3N64_06950 [Sporolactobacillus sp. CPB3-1]|uniref:DUF4871 domain-containing protein n=1 Tax=Sporolactobacillus mangiferae TaxID=2940498 RepID=A0ABT0M9Y1_9BACL|nr:hypothetical protein [Sporolactobacillus mangiferae]MCL1631686.1 hypothetical protein [Sporolactobacillus mangiferae]